MAIIYCNQTISHPGVRFAGQSPHLTRPRREKYGCPLPTRMSKEQQKETLYMRQNTIRTLLALMCCVFILNNLFACATASETSIHNQLPDNIPRGYIEFYVADEHESPDVPFWPWCVRKSDEDPNNAIFCRNSRSQKRVILHSLPGSHTFIVRCESIERSITVNVTEGMIIPIRVTTIVNKRGQSFVTNAVGSTTTKYYDISMFVSVENMRPFVKSD